MKTNCFALFVFLVNLCTPMSLEACTRVFLNQNGAMVSGRTFDWDNYYNETILVLPRGMQHRGGALVNEATWKSKLGSLVVQENYQQQTAITDGVNEAGLAVHLLSFEDSQYELRDRARPGVNVLQWLQYYLDHFSSVKEALRHVHDVQIETANFGPFEALALHIAMEDASGDSAILEFVGGKLTVHHHKTYRIMTNEPAYPIQLKNLSLHEGMDCPKATMPLNDASESRFVRAACYLRDLPRAENNKHAVALVSSILENAAIAYGMSKTEATWWRTMIDFKEHRYYFKSTRVPTFFWLDYSKINFSKQKVYRKIDAHNPRLMGDVT